MSHTEVLLSVLHSRASSLWSVLSEQDLHSVACLHPLPASFMPLPAASLAKSLPQVTKHDTRLLHMP